MHATEPIQRVRIYLNERDAVGGQPLFLAALELLREAGATGATALRGIAGFGASQQLRAEQTGAAKAMPIVIEWLDRAERVARVLPLLDTLLPDALVTIEEVRVYRATLRSSGPFGERTLSQSPLRTAVAAGRQDRLGDAVQTMLQHNQPLLPVLDAERRVIGVVAAPDLSRQGLPNLALLRGLGEDDQAAALAAAQASVGDSMEREPRLLAGDASVLQAANTMIEWGNPLLPVIDRDGRLLGLFGIAEALRVALENRPATDGPIREVGGSATVGVLMQAAGTTVIAHSPASAALERLLATPDQSLLVTDNNKPLGMLATDDLLQRLEEPLRKALAAAIRSPSAANLAALGEAAGELRAASLPLVPLPTLEASAAREQAIQLLLDQGLDRLAVIDDQGKIIGTLTQRTILRTLVQESVR